MLHSLRNFDENKAAGQRMKIIKFYEEYGEKAAKQAFGADRKVISPYTYIIGVGGKRGLNKAAAELNL